MPFLATLKPPPLDAILLSIVPPNTLIVPVSVAIPPPFCVDLLFATVPPYIYKLALLATNMPAPLQFVILLAILPPYKYALQLVAIFIACIAGDSLVPLFPISPLPTQSQITKFFKLLIIGELKFEELNLCPFKQMYNVAFVAPMLPERVTSFVK